MTCFWWLYVRCLNVLHFHRYHVYSYWNAIEVHWILKSFLLVVCIYDITDYIQIVVNLPQILMNPVKKTIQCVSVPNLNLFGPMKTELWVKEVGKFSIMLYGKMGQHVCHNINVWSFPIFWPALTLAFLVYRPKICRDLSKQGHLHCVKIFFKKIVNLYFWWRHCEPRIEWATEWKTCSEFS